MSMSNTLRKISASEVEAIKKTLASEDFLVAEIDGQKCQSLKEYLKDISDIFEFPMRPSGLDGYNDWICDLTWISADKKIAIIITCFSEFLKNDTISKSYITDDFEHIILPWWDSDVLNHVVNGKRRTFIVYLVD